MFTPMFFALEAVVGFETHEESESSMVFEDFGNQTAYVIQ